MIVTRYYCEDCDHEWEDKLDQIHCLTRDGEYNDMVYKNYAWTCPNCSSHSVFEKNEKGQLLDVASRIQINSHFSEQDELEAHKTDLGIRLVDILSKINSLQK